TRAWALNNPNAYRLIFQTSIGSGQDFAVDRTIPASSRSMSVIIEALVAVTMVKGPASVASAPAGNAEMDAAFRSWAERSGVTDLSTEVLALAFLTWTRLHGIISLELGGHLAATGIGAAVLFEAEVQTIRSQAGKLPPATGKSEAERPRMRIQDPT
ncbi:MAG: WHG domain-containing protein, partial [Actinomycetota bacterium]|nr:WHG domain-containing protein [Actinomycetota bacterium]